MPHRFWSVTDEVTLKRLAKQGLSPAQIGERLVRSAESIRKRGIAIGVSFGAHGPKQNQQRDLDRDKRSNESQDATGTLSLVANSSDAGALNKP